MDDKTRATRLLGRRNVPVTVGRYLIESARWKVPIAILVLALAYFAWTSGATEAAYLAIGFWLGALARTVRVAGDLQRAWPFTMKVVDGEIVKSLAEDHPLGPPLRAR